MAIRSEDLKACLSDPTKINASTDHPEIRALAATASVACPSRIRTVSIIGRLSTTTITGEIEE